MTTKTINFLNEYYKSRSTDNNATDLVNMFLEVENPNAEHGKYKITAIGTDGLTVFNSDSGSIVRGMFEHRGVLYSVVDNKFYSYASDGTRSEEGTLDTSTGQVGIAAITNQIMIVDGTKGYNFNTGTSTFATITDGEFPANPTTVTAQDEFFLVGVANSTLWYASDVADGTSWNALSFASKTGSGDFLIKLLSNKREVWLFGDKTTEVWYNEGSPTFSFARNSSVFIHFGCSSKDAVVLGDNTVFLLAKTPTGGHTVVMYNNYAPQVISTPAVDYQINLLTTHSNAIAYIYRKDGHEFYVLTFPTDAKTFVYDIAMGVWHERQSTISGSQTRHIGNCYAYAFNKHLIGAFNSGTIYQYSNTVYQENGASMLRRIKTPPAYAQGKKLFVNKLQVDMETNVGSNLTMTLDVSTNSGQTFPAGKQRTGNIPASGGRLYWRRFGYTQNAFVFQLSTTVNAKVICLGAIAELDVGTN